MYGYGKDLAVTLIGFVQVGDVIAAKRHLKQLFEASRNINPFTQRSEDTFRFDDLSHVYKEYAHITKLYPISESLEFTEDFQGLSSEDPQFLKHLEYWWNYWDSRDHEESSTETHNQFTSNDLNNTFSTRSSYSPISEIPWGPILIGGVVLCILGFLGTKNKMLNISTDQSNSLQTARVIPFQGNQTMNVRSCSNKTCDSVATVSVGEYVTIVGGDVNGWSEIVTSQRKQGFIDPRSLKRIY